jgi:hypothetical protein
MNCAIAIAENGIHEDRGVEVRYMYNNNGNHVVVFED